ncbi:MAG: hypothetical protein QM762_16110 [Chryseolinea sp.]
MVETILQQLTSRKTSNVLVALNIIVSFTVFFFASKNFFPDERGYILLGESFRHGTTFSSWYFLSTPLPETLRTWGYPYFLFLAQSMFDSLMFVKVIQFLFYLASVWLCWRLISQFTNSILSINIFLLLSVINIQVPYYAGLIAAESLCVFFTLLYFYLLAKQMTQTLTLREAILWGVIAFINFQLRPAFIVIPFMTAVFLIFDSFRRHRTVAVGHLLIFIVGLMPFAFWNLKHHQVFKLTPLQGGAGVTHIGYWAYLLPPNYRENFLWSNNVGDDVFMNLVAERSPTHVVEFENEWAQIKAGASLFLTKNDSAILSTMEQRNPGIFITYNSQYTLAQEKLLWHYTLQHISERPFFFIKTRLISACRVWFTGINKSQWQESHGVTGKLKILAPFLITFTFIFGGILYVTWSLARSKKLFRKYGIYLGLILIWGACHSIFAIQARYGVPMHLIILVLVASISAELRSKPQFKQA